MLSVLPFTRTYCKMVSVLPFTRTSVKCYPNKTVFFIVFSVTVLLQGQFKVETTTSFQRCINIETTTLFQPHFNHISTLYQRG